MRDDTPFKLRTKEETSTFGGYSTSRCTPGLAVHSNESRFEVAAHSRKMRLESIERVGIKHLSAILCHKDQMSVKRKHAMPASS